MEDEDDVADDDDFQVDRMPTNRGGGDVGGVLA